LTVKTVSTLLSRCLFNSELRVGGFAPRQFNRSAAARGVDAPVKLKSMVLISFRPITFIGKRAKLVPLQVEHVDALYAAAQSPEIWTHFPLDLRSLQDMAQFVQTSLREQEKGIDLPFAIVDQEEEQIVGATKLLRFSAGHRKVEIGSTWLSPKVWRTRINTECKYMLLRHCFEELDLIRVGFKVDTRNVRSQHAVERLGTAKEGVLRSHRILPDGYIRDTVLYSIVAQEWPAVKERLENFLK